jgi:hypothetical protein
MDYVRSLDAVPGSRVDQRVLLQAVADGDPTLRVAENTVRVTRALDDLDVTAACVAWSDPFTAEVFADWEPGFAYGPWTCWSR